MRTACVYEYSSDIKVEVVCLYSVDVVFQETFDGNALISGMSFKRDSTVFISYNNHANPLACNDANGFRKLMDNYYWSQYVSNIPPGSLLLKVVEGEEEEKKERDST